MVKIILLLRLIASIYNPQSPAMIPVECIGNSAAVPCAYLEVAVGDGIAGYYSEGPTSDAGFYVCKYDETTDDCTESIVPDDGALWQVANMLCTQDTQGKYTVCAKTTRDVYKRMAALGIPTP